MHVRAGMELTADRCEVECLHPELVGPVLGKVIARSEADDLAGMFNLLADPTRARLLHLLSLTEELCVCDMALVVGISQSAISHQLRMLRDRRVLSRRKVGRMVYYRLADDHIRHVLADGLRHVREDLPANEREAG